MFKCIFQYIIFHLLIILSGHCHFAEFIQHLETTNFAVISQITAINFVSKANLNPWLLKIMPRSIENCVSVIIFATTIEHIMGKIYRGTQSLRT